MSEHFKNVESKVHFLNEIYNSLKMHLKLSSSVILCSLASFTALESNGTKHWQQRNVQTANTNALSQTFPSLSGNIALTVLGMCEEWKEMTLKHLMYNSTLSLVFNH